MDKYRRSGKYTLLVVDLPMKASSREAYFIIVMLTDNPEMEVPREAVDA